jgi:hypothetical protein
MPSSATAPANGGLKEALHSLELRAQENAPLTRAECSGGRFTHASGVLKLLDHARKALVELLIAHRLAQTLDHEREGERGRPFDRVDAQGLTRDLAQAHQQPVVLEFILQHFAARLLEEKIVRIITKKDFPKKT